MMQLVYAREHPAQDLRVGHRTCEEFGHMTCELVGAGKSVLVEMPSTASALSATSINTDSTLACPSVQARREDGRSHKRKYLVTHVKAAVPQMPSEDSTGTPPASSPKTTTLAKLGMGPGWVLEEADAPTMRASTASATIVARAISSTFSSTR